ncbi:hypothetical protein BDW22DRAFT_1487066 [Trametopsis cervina]|nr:hypothetical protein BDW22DRAFT_1487066 [Trametopsis cervina]
MAQYFHTANYLRHPHSDLMLCSGLDSDTSLDHDHASYTSLSSEWLPSFPSPESLSPLQSASSPLTYAPSMGEHPGYNVVDKMTQAFGPVFNLHEDNPYLDAWNAERPHVDEVSTHPIYTHLNMDMFSPVTGSATDAVDYRLVSEALVPAALPPNVFDIRTHASSGTEVGNSSAEPHSDEDAEGETDDDDDDRDYIPPSSPVTPKRSPRLTKATTPSSANRRMSPYTPPRSLQRHRRANSAPSSSSSPRAARSPRSTSDDTARIFTTRRAIAGTGKPNFDAVDANGYPRCETCSWTFKKTRPLDFRRHVLSHFPDEAAKIGGPVVCCGVPVALRSAYGIGEDVEVSYFAGTAMVGGCGKEFSRKDALGRHLENKNLGCVGDLKGNWH